MNFVVVKYILLLRYGFSVQNMKSVSCEIGTHDSRIYSWCSRRWARECMLSKITKLPVLAGCIFNLWAVASETSIRITAEVMHLWIKRLCWNVLKLYFFFCFIFCNGIKYLLANKSIFRVKEKYKIAVKSEQIWG